MKDIEKAILPTNTKLFCKKVDGVEGVAICFCFGAGALQEPILKDEHGNMKPVRHLAHLLEHIFFSKKSTPTHSESERQDFFATMGYYNGSTFLDEMLLQYVVHNSLLETLFEDVGQVIARKTISQEEMNHEKSVIKEEVLLRAKAKSKREFDKFLMKKVFAEPSLGRYADADGPDIKERLDSITLEELETFRKEKFALDNLSIFAAGDITLERLQELTDKYLSILPQKAKMIEPRYYDATTFQQPSINFVDTDSKGGCVMYFVFKIDQKPPRQFMKIVNSILSLHWNDAAREGGFAYRTLADWWQNKESTFIKLSLSTSSENASHVLDEISKFFKEEKFLINEKDYQTLLRRRALNSNLDQSSLGSIVTQMINLCEKGYNLNGAEEDELAKEKYDNSTTTDYNDFIKPALTAKPYVLIASNEELIEKIKDRKFPQYEND